MGFEDCYRAIEMKDGRFDGWFITAVTSTGIYCRPSCPARTPHARNVRFYATAAAAQEAGFRACKRCRPDASPGSPNGTSRGDLVGRAMRLISDGVVDREGVGGLARRLGYTRAAPAQVPVRRRSARGHWRSRGRPGAERPGAAGAHGPGDRGYGPDGRVLERAAVQHLDARGVRDDADAAASGTPSAAGGRWRGLTVRLPARVPFDGDALISFLAARAVPGIEEVVGGAYRRSLRLPHGFGVVELARGRGPRQGHAAGWRTCATSVPQ